MNFKRNYLVIMSVLASTMLVAGCSSDDNFKHFEFIQELIDNHEEEHDEFGSYVKYGDYDDFTSDIDTQVNLGKTQDLMRTYGGKALMNTTGDQKLLVIPVEFKDYDCKKLGIKEEEYVRNLEISFFGVADENKYVSVSEYFNRSSYGKLRLSGKVADKFYPFSKSIAEIKQGFNRDNLKNEYERVIEWYKLNFDDIDEYKIDPTKGTEGSDFNVPIYLVYTFPTDLNDNKNSIFWAFTYPSVPFSWSSYSFLAAEKGKPDAHTFIHETGHLFGLVDYYPTNVESDALVPEPTGRIDMMDCSIGDETAFSKMYLDWARPYHIQNTTEITLRSFANNGDLLLFNDDWNKTVFDEYYLIEFYTPTGLNTYDACIGNSEAKLPNLPGIKMYHVDASIATFDFSGVRLQWCRDLASVPARGSVNYGYDNNTKPEEKNESETETPYLYKLIPNNSGGQMLTGRATSANLYRTGDLLPKFEFYNKENHTSYTIEVVSVSFNEAKLKIDKKTI